MLDAESLKAMGVTTIGQRLAILKAVYLLKLANDVPIDSDHYVPPCQCSHFRATRESHFLIAEAQERQESVTLEGLHDAVKDQGTHSRYSCRTCMLNSANEGERLRHLEEENRRLNEILQMFLEEFNRSVSIKLMA